MVVVGPWGRKPFSHWPVDRFGMARFGNTQQPVVPSGTEIKAAG